MAEKKQELEKRLQDVSGQLGGSTKKQTKKGGLLILNILLLRELIVINEN